MRFLCKVLEPGCQAGSHLGQERLSFVLRDWRVNSFLNEEKSALADGTKRFASGSRKTARSTFSVDKLTAREKSFSSSSWIYISVHICFSALEGNEVCVCVYFEREIKTAA